MICCDTPSQVSAFGTCDAGQDPQMLTVSRSQGSTMAFQRLNSGMRRGADGREYGVRE